MHRLYERKYKCRYMYISDHSNLKYRQLYEIVVFSSLVAKPGAIVMKLGAVFTV